MLSAAPSAPATGDPCSVTTGADSVANRVCYAGKTITVADGLVHDVAAGIHGQTTFVTFHVGDARFAVVSDDEEAWSVHLPADPRLGLRPGLTTTMPGNPLGILAEPGPYRLVRLATPMIHAWADAFEERGITVHAYYPVNHFLVRLPDTAGDTGLHDLAFVEEVTFLSPLAKVEPGFVRVGGVRDVSIMYRDAPGARDAVAARLGDIGATITRDAPEVERFAGWVSAERLHDLASVPDVIWIDRAGEGPAEEDMDIIRQMTGADYLLGLPAGFDGSSVVGQVVDGGGPLLHGDHAACLQAIFGGSGIGSHGTEVFGIVCGSGAGSAPAKGMAPGAAVSFAPYITSSPGYRYSRAALSAPLGGVFQTHSWGNPVPKDNTYDSYSNENDRVVSELDVLMLQSMSNCGPQCARREAMAKNIISVGALYHRNTAALADDVWAGGGSAASTGPAADGRIKPELVGPYDSIYTTAYGGGYTGGFGGTSGATPVVAGSVALTHDMWNAGVFGTNGTASPAMAKALLIASANAYDPNQVRASGDQSPTHQWFDEPVKRDIQGWGLPDLQALHKAGATALVHDETNPLATGQTASYSYTVPPGAALVHVTLVWTDAPASPGANPTLVNDLDLTVGVPTPLGSIGFLGNHGLDQLELSLPGGDRDALNNHENVFLPAIPGTTIGITVRGTAVNVDQEPATAAVDQPFALVVLAL